MKLYYAQPKHGPKAILEFEGQPLITNSPTLFLYLIRLNNEKAKFPSQFMDEDIEIVELKAKVKENK